MTREQATFAIIQAVRKATTGLRFGSLYSNFSLDDDGDELDKEVRKHPDLQQAADYIAEFFLNYAHGDEFQTLSWPEAISRLQSTIQELEDIANIDPIPLDIAPPTHE
jgi:hypothetical protein